MQKMVDFSKANSMIHLPSKVVLAVTEKPSGGYNLITLEWFMRTSIEPLMYAISIGHNRYSHDCLEVNRYFNLVFPSADQKALLNLSGSTSGKTIDKFKEGRVDFTYGKYMKLPLLNEAVANLECEIVTQVRSGDHTIYVGQVHYCWLDENKEFLYIPRP